MFNKGGFVYIMASPNRNVLYTGVTSNLKDRVYQHRNKTNSISFSAKYNCVTLVYFQFFETIALAIKEEKRIKAGNRKNKELLIEGMNNEWKDLWDDIYDW